MVKISLLDQIGTPLKNLYERPVLKPVIHTEEEFPWDQPFDRSNRGTGHVKALEIAQTVFENHNILPLYVLSDPIAKDPIAREMLGQWVRDGKAEIGAHLHPWTVEPFEETVNNRHSYPGNLPESLEFEKLKNLTTTIETMFGEKPKAYLAGRYGLGPKTAKTLNALGYLIDFSPSPTYNFQHQEGQDYRRWPQFPTFNRHQPDILHIPHACGYTGAMAKAGQPTPMAQRLRNQSPLASRLLGASGLLQHGRVSPEGMPLSQMKNLSKALLNAGASVITFSFHSPTLVPGHTDYVNNSNELESFLEKTDRFCHWFTRVMGGKTAGLGDLYSMAQQKRGSHD